MLRLKDSLWLRVENLGAMIDGEGGVGTKSANLLRSIGLCVHS